MYRYPVLIFFSFLFDLQSRAQEASLQEKWMNKQLPVFTGTTLQGNVVNTREDTGKIVLVNLSYRACLACIYEIPFLNRLQNEFDSSQFKLLSIANNTLSQLAALNSSTDSNKYAYIRRALVKDSIQYPILAACDVIDSSIGDLGCLCVLLS